MTTADADQPFDQEGRVAVPDVSTRFDFLACRFAHRGPVPPSFGIPLIVRKYSSRNITLSGIPSFASVGPCTGPYSRKDWLAGRVVDVTRRRRST